MQELYWLVPAAVAAYLLVVPLLFLAIFNKDADTVVVYVDDDAPLPAEVLRHFVDAEESLEYLGFEVGDMMYVPYHRETHRFILQLFINRKNQTSAMVVTMFTLVNGGWSIGNQYVEFMTEGNDGFTVQSLNSREIDFPKPETTIISYLFCLKDIPQLHAAHCALSDFHVPHESRLLRLETEFGGNAADYVADVMKQEFRELVRSGYLRLTADGTAYRFTFIGAYKATWQHLPPFKGLIRSLRKRQALNRLASVGWDMHSPAV
jgi:hypothetical protein